MGLEKRTKIIVSVFVFLIIVGGSLGLLLGFLWNHSPYIELEAWPQPADGGRLIQFKLDSDSWHPWVRRINELLTAYSTPDPDDPPSAPCSTRPDSEDPQRSERCAHAMRYWAPCTVDTFYEYIRRTPCVFLSLTHIDQWTPQPYNKSVDLPIPSDMPAHLKKGLNHPSAKHEDYIWVSCKGESQADEDNVGRIRYIPENLPPGFPMRRLLTERPEASTDGGPLIALLFQNLTRHTWIEWLKKWSPWLERLDVGNSGNIGGVIVNVECRIWTRDIVYDANGSAGRTRFEILVN